MIPVYSLSYCTLTPLIVHSCRIWIYVIGVRVRNDRSSTRYQLELESSRTIMINLLALCVQVLSKSFAFRDLAFAKVPRRISKSDECLLHVTGGCKPPITVAYLLQVFDYRSIDLSIDTLGAGTFQCRCQDTDIDQPRRSFTSRHRRAT